MASTLWQTVFLYSARSKSYAFSFVPTLYRIPVLESSCREKYRKRPQVLRPLYDIKGKSTLLSMLNI